MNLAAPMVTSPLTSALKAEASRGVAPQLGGIGLSLAQAALSPPEPRTGMSPHPSPEAVPYLSPNRRPQGAEGGLLRRSPSPSTPHARTARYREPHPRAEFEHKPSGGHGPMALARRRHRRSARPYRGFRERGAPS